MGRSHCSATRPSPPGTRTLPSASGSCRAETWGQGQVSRGVYPASGPWGHSFTWSLLAPTGYQGAGALHWHVHGHEAHTCMCKMPHAQHCPPIPFTVALPLRPLPLAMLRVAEAAGLALKAVEPLRAESLLTPVPVETGLTQAGSVDVVAAPTVGTVTLLAAVLPMPADAALLLASGGKGLMGGLGCPMVAAIVYVQLWRN